ncbi:MAG: protein kinase, partial [Polyangiaceae bacterium]
ALDYVLQACEAIAEAHKLGIVHRDLKPSNLFLAKRADGSPLVKLLDFGISKATETLTSPMELAAVTSTQNILGSPLYMSPEQLRSAKNVDARADVWSLGVILYELISGTPPFMGESVSHVLTIIVADPHAPLSSMRADVPADLSAVIDKALSKTKEGRYQSVSELARALMPHAPRHARVSVERISRLAGDEEPPDSLATTRPSVPSDAPVVQAPVPAVSSGSTPAIVGTTSQSSTHEPVSSSRPSRSSTPAVASVKKSPLMWLVPTAALLFGGALWIGFAGHHDAPVQPAVAATPTAPPSPIAPEVSAAPASTLAAIDSPPAAVDAGAVAITGTTTPSEGASALKPATHKTALTGSSASTSSAKPASASRATSKPGDGFDPLGGRN